MTTRGRHERMQHNNIRDQLNDALRHVPSEELLPVPIARVRPHCRATVERMLSAVMGLFALGQAGEANSGAGDPILEGSAREKGMICRVL
jgi:hypothetical protein